MIMPFRNMPILFKVEQNQSVTSLKISFYCKSIYIRIFRGEKNQIANKEMKIVTNLFLKPYISIIETLPKIGEHEHVPTAKPNRHFRRHVSLHWSVFTNLFMAQTFLKLDAYT